VTAGGAAAARAQTSGQPDAGVPPTPAPTPAPDQTATPAPAPAPPATSDQEMADIEAALGADAKTAAATQPPPPPAATAGALQSMNPDISVVGDVALAAFSDDAPLQTGDHDPASNGFVLQQVELSISKAVDPYFRFDSNIVFHAEGVEVEEAYATTLALPYNLQARVGQFLNRFGRINPTHPHVWDFVDQPFEIGRVFGGEGSRGPGVELSYLTPLPWYVELVGAATGGLEEGTARSFSRGEEATVDDPGDLVYVAAAKQFLDLSDDLSLLHGVSWATGPSAGDPTGDGRANVFGTDLYLKYRPITYGSHTIISLQLEYLYRRRDIPGDVLTDHGGYGQLFWRFAQRWAAGARYEFGAAAKDEAGLTGRDPLDPEWTDARHRVSTALTFWPTEFSRLRAQGSVDIPTWRDDPIWAAFLAMEFSVGVHGAHSF
jgi:hypothetical protein